MRTYKDAKTMAKCLRDVLATRNVAVSHGECLEIVAQQFGFSDWNTLSSKLSIEERQSAPIKEPDAPVRATRASLSSPIAARLPVMPLRDIVVYPGIVIPLFAGRVKTIRAVEEAMSGDKRVMLLTQRRPEVDEPTADDLYPIGTIANVLEEWELRKTAEPPAADMMLVPDIPGPTRKVLIQGNARARVGKVYGEGYVSADVTVLNDTEVQNGGELDGLKAIVMTRFEKYARLSGWPPKVETTRRQSPALADILAWFCGLDIGRFADAIAAHSPLQLAQKQEVLELLDVRRRLEYVDAATRELERAGPTSKK